MQALYTAPLPAGMRPSGMAIGPDSSLAIWSIGSGSILIAKDSVDLVEWDIDAHRILGGAFVDEDVLSFFASDGNRVLSLSIETGALRYDTLWVPGLAEHAVLHGGTWFVVVRRFDAIELVKAGESREDTESIATWALTAEDQSGIGMSSSHGCFLASRVRRPFHVWRVQLDARAALEQQSTGRSAADTTGNWVGLPALCTSEGWMQVLADLTSDERLLRRSDTSITRLTLPWGLLASDGEDLLAGAIDVGEAIAVLYTLDRRRE